MIPAKIHYCWFGKKPLPETALQCIQSWKKYLPEYKIIRWDEEKLLLDCEFVKRAYKAGKWAFVSDYMRLVVLYQEGGVYMDTDMLILRNIDSFLNQSCFLGFENQSEVNAAILGAEAKHPFIKSLIEIYQNMTFELSKPLPIPKVVSEELQRNNLSLNNKHQSINDISLFPNEYFYPLPQDNKQESYYRYLTENSYAVHLWDYSWINEFSYFWKGDYKEGLKKTWQTLRKSPLQSISYYKDIMYHLGRYFTS